MRRKETYTLDSSDMICYFDCFSGISGDMILGALVDAGVPLQKLRDELSCLPLKGYKLDVKTAKRAGLMATKIDVQIEQRTKSKKQRQETLTRKWKDIEKIIKNSTLSENIKQKGLLIFKRLFEVEAKVHGKSFKEIHLHELGAVDCMIDIFGTLIGLDILGIETIYSSHLNLGGGTIKTEHGILPVPAPATIELLQNIPVYSSDMPFELTTPTGAVIISSLATRFGPMPDMHISKIGIGAGNKNFKKQPNVLRLLIGQSHVPPRTVLYRAVSGTWQSPVPDGKGQSPPKHRTQNPPSPPFSKGGKERINNEVLIIETNIDDMTPQIYEYVMEKLFKSGALDVFLTQIIMKKGRPGVKLTVLSSEDKKDELIKIILEETTSIGLRFYRAERKSLQREIKSLNTKFGRVNVKISRLGKDICRITPEYEDCKKIAKKYNIPLIDVMKTIKEPK